MLYTLPDTVNDETFTDRLNSLAVRIPPLAFRATGKTDHVVYVILGPDPDGVAADLVVGSVGEGKLERATKQLRRRGKNDDGFDDYIAAHWPNFEVYLAASNVTKSVSLEFEGILMDALKPRFGVAPKRSTNWRGFRPDPMICVRSCVPPNGSTSSSRLRRRPKTTCGTGSA